MVWRSSTWMPARSHANTPVQRTMRLGLGGEAAATERFAAAVDGGEVDGEGPAAVAAVGEFGAAGAELLTCGVAAGVAAVDAASVRGPAHDRAPFMPLIGPAVASRVDERALGATTARQHRLSPQVRGRALDAMSQDRCGRRSPLLVPGGVSHEGRRLAMSGSAPRGTVDSDRVAGLQLLQIVQLEQMGVDCG